LKRKPHEEEERDPLDRIVQKHAANDYDRARYRKQNAVEFSREKEKSLHEADRAGMIEEFRVDRELAMQEFKDQLNNARMAQLKMGSPKIPRNKTAEPVWDTPGSKRNQPDRFDRVNLEWEVQEVKVKRCNIALENLKEYEAGEAEREAQRARVQAAIAVERQRTKQEKERTRAIDDFKEERERAWTDYERQLENMTGKSPVLRSPRVKKSPPRSNRPSGSPATTPSTRPGGANNSTIVTDDAQILHRTKGFGFSTPNPDSPARAANRALAGELAQA